MKYILMLCAVSVLGLGVSTESVAQDGVPFEPGEQELRIMTWNIENLGSRIVSFPTRVTVLN